MTETAAQSVRLNNVRLSFPRLFRAEQVMGEGDPTYSASFLIEKGSAAEKVARSAIREIISTRWREYPTKLKVCLRDGDQEKSEYEGYPGHFFFNARSKNKPTTIDRGRQEVAESDGLFYAGCYVNAVVEFWAQDNRYGKRVNASLRGVQFVRNGEPFTGGAGAAKTDDFPDLGEDVDDDDLF